MRFVSSFLGFVFRPLSALVERLVRIPIVTLLVGSGGLVLGLVVAILLSLTLPFDLLPGAVGRIVPTFLTLLIVYLSVQVFLKKQNELTQFFSPPPRAEERRTPPKPKESQFLIDTSVIIDGRIEGVIEAGFLSGVMLVPNFVLQEIQHLADSTEPLRRRRGRRGLEMLNNFQKNEGVTISVLRVVLPRESEADEGLIELALSRQIPLITTDFNLQRAAELQGIRVLNIQGLAAALRLKLQSGDVIEVEVVGPGREAGQGLGYLDDGTVVVVEGGRRLVGETAEVVVQRIYQTPTGHMVFGIPGSTN